MNGNEGYMLIHDMNPTATITAFSIQHKTRNVQCIKEMSVDTYRLTKFDNRLI